MSYFDKFKSAKLAYQGVMHKRKPDKKILGLITTTWTGLDAALNACDAADPNSDDETLPIADPKKLASAGKKLRSRTDSYLKVLDKAIQDDKDANQGVKTAGARRR